MTAIQVLPSAVVGKIAAGEVIERPASVVKELIENALDAGASSISIEIRAGGRELIRVMDDGDGIPAGELHIAVERHSTSKLRSEDDLRRIRTLGFRGEALASITAVAELDLASVPKGALAGRRIVATGGAVLRDEAYGGPPGTEVNVRRLFQSLPARLEFLKSDRTESSHIINVAQHLAIAHPAVRFALAVDDRPAFQTAGSGSLRDALLALFGAGLLETLVEIEPGGFLGVEGMVSQPGRDRANRSHIAFYINGRWVTNPVLSGALAEAYRGLIPSGRHPAAYLRLELPPEELDVNVHPAKAEVRMRDNGRVFTRLASAIRRTLVDRAEFVAVAVDSQKPVVDSLFTPAPFPPSPDRLAAGPTAPPGGAAGGAVPEPSGGGITSPWMRALGQIDRTYVVAAAPDGLYLLDQHTAHERVIYEELLNSAGEPVRQQVLGPLPVELGGFASAWLQEHAAALSSLGLEVEPFGGTAWIVRAVPAMAAGQDPGGFLSQVIGELAGDTSRRADAVDRLRWSVACKCAVKAGDLLSLLEMQALVDRLQKCDLGRTCPHGRPTTLKLSRELLDRQFGRA